MGIHSGKELHNSSKGCGGVMHVAPIALFGLGEDRLSSIEAMDKLAAEAAEMTHLNPLGYIPAAMMVKIKIKPIIKGYPFIIYYIVV